MFVMRSAKRLFRTAESYYYYALERSYFQPVPEVARYERYFRGVIFGTAALGMGTGLYIGATKDHPKLETTTALGVFGAFTGATVGLFHPVIVPIGFGVAGMYLLAATAHRLVGK